jgi:hypothetical protein
VFVNQVDLSSENLFEIQKESAKLEQIGLLDIDIDINVTSWSGFIPSGRTEDRERSDAVDFTQSGPFPSQDFECFVARHGIGSNLGGFNCFEINAAIPITSESTFIDRLPSDQQNWIRFACFRVFLMFAPAIASLSGLE